MGGRLGDYSGYMDSGSARTESYQTLATGSDNIEIIQGVGNENRSAPIYSNSPNRIYVNINKKTGKIESITIYKNHKEVYSIHPGYDGSHGGLHVHSPRVVNGKRTFLKVSQEHKDIYDKVLKLYNKKG